MPASTAESHGHRESRLRKESVERARALEPTRRDRAAQRDSKDRTNPRPEPGKESRHRGQNAKAARWDRPANHDKLPSRSLQAKRKAGSLRRIWNRFGELIERYPAEISLISLSFVVAMIMIVPFASDLFFNWPMRGASLGFDLSNTICGLAMLLLCWNAFRGLR